MFEPVRKAIGALALLFTALVLSGCSPEPSGRSVDSTRTRQITISALVWAPDWPLEMNRIADEFMAENPDIKVNVQFMIGNSVEENIKPKIASNNLPDIMSINPNAYAAGLADQGILADIGTTGAWDNMLDSLKADWITAAGRRFGIAGGVASTLIYYNQSMFDKAGITALPRDFDEFLVLCATLKKAGFVPMMWNGGFPNMLGNGPFSFGFANEIIAGNPNWKVGIASGKIDLNTVEAAAIFTKIKLLPDLGYVQKNYLSTGYDEGLKLFTDGKTAMAFQGTWASGVLMHAKGFKTGIMIPPWNSVGKPLIPVIGSETGFGICETKNKAEALKFLEFVYGKGFAIQQAKRQNIAPLKKVAVLVRADPQVANYVSNIGAAPVTGSLYYSFLPANTIDMLHPLMQDVLFGTTTPLQAAAALDHSVKREARNNNK